MLDVKDLRKSFAGPEGARVEVVRIPQFSLGAGEERALRFIELFFAQRLAKKDGRFDGVRGLDRGEEGAAVSLFGDDDPGG